MLLVQLFHLLYLYYILFLYWFLTLQYNKPKFGSIWLINWIIMFLSRSSESGRVDLNLVWLAPPTFRKLLEFVLVETVHSGEFSRTSTGRDRAPTYRTIEQCNRTGVTYTAATWRVSSNGITLRHFSPRQNKFHRPNM